MQGTSENAWSLCMLHELDFFVTAWNIVLSCRMHSQEARGLSFRREKKSWSGLGPNICGGITQEEAKLTKSLPAHMMRGDGTCKVAYAAKEQHGRCQQAHRCLTICSSGFSGCITWVKAARVTSDCWALGGNTK